jgi:hypothetical protein
MQRTVIAWHVTFMQASMHRRSPLASPSHISLKPCFGIASCVSNRNNACAIQFLPMTYMQLSVKLSFSLETGSISRNRNLTEDRLFGFAYKIIWFWHNRCNTVTMVLASAFMKATTPWWYSKCRTFRRRMHLITALARNMAKAFWWQIIESHGVVAVAIFWFESPFCLSLFCDNIYVLSFQVSERQDRVGLCPI